jgi:hypothetical protein
MLISKEGRWEGEGEGDLGRCSWKEDKEEDKDDG